MGFGCPICSEKLDKLPAEAQGRNGGRTGGNELNISATPCGHIFHAYCIQKWLSGNLASSKQCPCCRKDVPRLRCLSLFPTSYDDSILDDSMSQVGGEGGGAAFVPCNHGEIITSLKNQIARLDAEVKDKDTMHKLLTEDHEALLDEFRREKVKSDTWMMKAQQYRSFEDEAQKWENRARNAESQLKIFSNVENMLKGVERSVNEELPNFPVCAESIRSLLEMKQVMSNEMQKVNYKFNEYRKKYDELRDEKVKLKARMDRQEKEYKELKHVYEISRLNGRIRSPEYPMAGPSSAIDIGTTPKAFRTKRRFLESSQRSVSSEELNAAGNTTPGVDQDVDVFPTTFKKSKSTKVLSSRREAHDAVKPSGSKSKASQLPISLSPIPTVDTPQPLEHQQRKKQRKQENTTPSPNTIVLGSSDEEDDLRIRGNVPGAALPIASSRMKTLQQRSERPTLGLSLNRPTTKKFNFKKPTV